MVSQIHLIANSLASSEKNHNVISQNIANVNTPGYQTQAMAFEELLTSIRDGSADKQLLDSIPVELVEGLQSRKDGNNVDLDSQMGQLKKNALLFQTYSQLLASKVSTVKRAMTR